MTITPNPDSRALAALARHKAGDLAGAHRAYLAFLSERPDDPHGNLWLAALLHQAGRFNAAEPHALKATEVAPQWPDGWVNLGVIRRALGKMDEAKAALQTATRLDASLDAAWVSLGSVLQDLGDMPAAEGAYLKAMDLAPGNALPAFNLATLLLSNGRTREAESAASEAVKRDRTSATALAVLADCRINLGDYDGALDALNEAEQYEPGNADLYATRGVALAELGRLPEASRALDHALERNPRHGPAIANALFIRRRLCDWNGIDRLADRFRTAIEQGTEGLAPFPWLAEHSTRREQLACARLWSERWPSANLSARGEAPALSNGRLTIGYVSADFYRHPTAYLAAGLFEQHDRDRFRVIAYSNSRDDDSDIRRRLEAGFDAFVDIRSLSPEAATEQIRKDGVDILVDLKGHTQEAATALFVQRPAPIQVQYLGYPGTLGLAGIDYLLGDPVVTPFEHAPDYSEHIVQLSGSYQVNDRHRPRPAATGSRADLGLPETGTVFCCFNNAWKFNSNVFSSWMAILSAVPGSVLWLLGRESAPEVSRHLRREAEAAGIPGERLVFTRTRPLEEYLALFHHADLFLDSWPYNAHTTASDALWMSCPVLTVIGDTFAGRVGASLLATSGLPSMICEDVGTYRMRAIELGLDREALGSLRGQLEQSLGDNPLFDTTATTRNIEAAYEEMARRHRAGTPGAFRV